MHEDHNSWEIENQQMMYEHLNSWEDVENVDHEHIPDQRAFFILIDLEFDAETYCQEHVVPVRHNDRADLSRIPNVFRTVLGFRMLTTDYDEMTLEAFRQTRPVAQEQTRQRCCVLL